MSGPFPYAPIQYQELQNLIFPGEVKRGDRFIWDIAARTPQFFASGTNKGLVSFFQGAAIARDPSGTGFILADNAAVATSTIGFACLGAPSTRAEIVQLAGLFTMDDWTPITGVVSLVPLAFYYLGANGGLTDILPIFPKIAQLVGYSISPKTLNLLFSQPVVGGGGAGPPIFKVTTTAVNYVINGADTVILASGNTLLTLPAAVGSGQSFWIKNIGVGVITIGGGGGNIDGAPTATLNTPNEAVQVIDGGVNNWYIF